MKNKTKEIIFKFLLINSAIALFYIVLCAIFKVFFSFSKITYILFDNINFAYIMFFVFGWSMVIFSLIFKIELSNKKTKPLKKQLIIKSNNKFIKNVSDYLSIYKYDEIELANYNSFQIKVFYKIKKFAFFKRIDFIIFLIKERLEKGDLDIFDEKIKVLIKSLIDKTKPTVLSFTSIVCVEKNSTEFKKYITSNMKQSYEIFKLSVGISYEDSKIYIVNQKDGPAIAQYKKLKKFFIKLLKNCNY